MKYSTKVILYSILGLLLIVILFFGLGYTGVFYTKTVGKSQQNAQREVFEQTQSFVEGKRQEAAKLYKEWKLAKTPEDKKTIEAVVSQNFANFDETLLEGDIRTFVYNCKYN